MLVALLVMTVDTAWSWSRELSSDGSTATVETPKDPLDKYRDAKSLSESELVDLLKDIGFEGRSLKVAWAVAMKESRGHPTSHNDDVSTGDDSYGLFQVNMYGSLGPDRIDKFQQNGISIQKKTELFDPVLNAQVVYYMTAKGKNWGSWGYGPGAYDGDPSEPKIEYWIDQFPNK